MTQATATKSLPETLSPKEHIAELNALVTKAPYSRTRILEIAEHYAAGQENAIENKDLASALASAAELHGVGEDPIVVAARRKIEIGPIGW